MAPSFNSLRSANYGRQVLVALVKFWLQKRGVGRFRMLNPQGRGLAEDFYPEVRGAGTEDDSRELREAE